MATELVPYTDLSSESIARELHEAVMLSEPVLRARNILGPISRYGWGLELGIQNVEKGQHEHDLGEIGRYAVMSDAGNIVGAASIYPNLSLRRLRVPVPPMLAVEYPQATPNIHAWTTGDTETLAQAYSRLRDLAHKKIRNQQVPPPNPANTLKGLIPWTIEPVSSPQYIHDALLRAGLTRNASQRFDDGESRRHIPPLSTLYTGSLQPIEPLKAE